MMKIVLGALALTAATTPALANNWSTTDRDLASLSSSLTQNASGVSVSGFLRSSYVGWSDADVGGFSIDDAQIWVNGTVGDVSVVVQTQAATLGAGLDIDADGIADVENTDPFSVGVLGDLGVLDAYASWNATEMIKVQLGQFRPAFLGSSLRNENNLLFINRSALGSAFDFRDRGVQVNATLSMVDVAVYAQDGSDGVGDELSFGARAQSTIMGTAGATEGALGASGDPSLTLGAAFLTDDLAGDFMGLDANFTMGALGFSAELVDFDDLGITPFNVAGSFVIMPDQLEAAIRYEDFDDANNTNWITVGANWYLQGHAAKWQFNYVKSDSDNPNADTDHFQVGLTVSM